MTNQTIASAALATALRRVEQALRRRPSAALAPDTKATARWVKDTQIRCSHDKGISITTDMPQQMGGTGEYVSPGWLLRAGIASCTATRIAMAAAHEGIELQSLELIATSETDVRGLLGMLDEQGVRVMPQPRDVKLLVRICAPGVPDAVLTELVERCHGQSPVSRAMEEVVPVALSIEVESP